MGNLVLCHHRCEDLDGRPEVGRGSGATVQPIGDGVQVGQGVHEEVGTLGRVLEQQPVGVLAGAALPRGLWGAEVDVDAALLGHSGVDIQTLIRLLQEDLSPSPYQVHA